MRVQPGETQCQCDRPPHGTWIRTCFHAQSVGADQRRSEPQPCITYQEEDRERSQQAIKCGLGHRIPHDKDPEQYQDGVRHCADRADQEDVFSPQPLPQDKGILCTDGEYEGKRKCKSSGENRDRQLSQLFSPWPAASARCSHISCTP